MSSSVVFFQTFVERDILMNVGNANVHEYKGLGPITDLTYAIAKNHTRIRKKSLREVTNGLLT